MPSVAIGQRPSYQILPPHRVISNRYILETYLEVRLAPENSVSGLSLNTAFLHPAMLYRVTLTRSPLQLLSTRSFVTASRNTSPLTQFWSRARLWPSISGFGGLFSRASAGRLYEQSRGMKVRSSVKKLCDGCKVSWNYNSGLHL